MKSWVFAVLVGAGVAVVSLSGACAGERKVKVTNSSQQIVTEIYAAPADTGDYKENVLGSAVRIQSGGTATVTFDDAGACAFDFQAITGDDDMLVALNVDVCAVPEFTLSQ